MTPDATPREALYIETGLLDIATIADSKRLNMKARLNREKSEMMRQVLSNPECLWEKETKATMEKHKIAPHELVGSKYTCKRTIKQKTLENFKSKIKESNKDKSKMMYFNEAKMGWKPGTRAKYMNELTRKQVSLIFKARTRMIKVKGNYKNGNANLMCRACKTESETQQHVLEECPEIHKDPSTKITKSQLFSEDTGTLRSIAKKLDEILKTLE